MKPGDKARVIERYNQRLAQFGDDIRTLSSGTEERREARYQVLCEVGLRNGASVSISAAASAILPVILRAAASTSTTRAATSTRIWWKLPGGYPLLEFCLYLYKDFTGWGK